MKTINELQDEVIEEFSDFDDWMDKYQLLIDLGNDQQPLDPKYKTEQNLIDGCQSRVTSRSGRRQGGISGRERRINRKRYHIFTYPGSIWTHT